MLICREHESLVKQETKLIDNHQHKIQHLLFVLQQEMANETKREIS